MSSTDHGRRSRRRLARGLAVAALCGAAAIPATAGATPTAATGDRTPHPLRTDEIAATTFDDERKVTLTAVRSRHDELAASVVLTTYTYEDGRWRHEDRTMVGDRDGWFWYPLTGDEAVCEFSTASADPQSMSVSLVITPSIGCSPSHHYHMEDGQIIAG